jgi:ComF family protein
MIMERSFLSSLKHDIIGIFDLVYPNVCAICEENVIPVGDNKFCAICWGKLPFTDHFIDEDNDMAMHLVGRLPFDYAGALLLFNEGGIVQKAVHNLKYRGVKEIGNQLGYIAGTKFKEYNVFTDIDGIVPVPLHTTKLKKRGYNQTTIIAEGIKEVINQPIIQNALIKEKATTSQTNKTREERLDNIKDNLEIKGRHILVVDDVITTGATLEACGRALLKGGAKKVSFFALAMAV